MLTAAVLTRCRRPLSGPPSPRTANSRCSRRPRRRLTPTLTLVPTLTLTTDPNPNPYPNPNPNPYPNPDPNPYPNPYPNPNPSPNPNKAASAEMQPDEISLAEVREEMYQLGGRAAAAAALETKVPPPGAAAVARVSGGASGGVSGGVSGGASGGGDGAAQGDRRAGTGAGAGAGAGTGAGADAAAAAAAGWVVVEAEVKKRRRVLASGSTNVSMCVLELQDGIYYGHTYHVHVAILWPYLPCLPCGDTMARLTVWRYYGDNYFVAILWRHFTYCVASIAILCG